MFVFQAYDGAVHHAFAAISESVPIFTVSSLSKRYLVPGWRLGWIVISDVAGVLTPDLRQSLISLTQRTLGPSSLLQGALPSILQITPQSSFDHTNNLIEVRKLRYQCGFTP